MSNYLNEIESDLYKLNSITNGSGEVVEMVAELKEKYRKAEALDRIVKESKGAFSCGDFCDDVRHIINNYEIVVVKDDYCTKCTVKPIVKERMCDECYTEHCQRLRELSTPKQVDDQWDTLYESKA